MNIKTGDLVMVVKPTPCCSNPVHLGGVFTVARIARIRCECGLCGHVFHDPVQVTEGPGGLVLVSCLKKIDPPADGDSLPTRKDLEVLA